MGNLYFTKYRFHAVKFELKLRRSTALYNYILQFFRNRFNDIIQYDPIIHFLNSLFFFIMSIVLY